MDSQKVATRTSRFGTGVFAIDVIEQGEMIAVFDGEEYQAEQTLDLPKEIADHAIQIAPHLWKDSNGIARYLNHSCNPNCGIQGLTDIVAMTRILIGEELLLDYDMTEASNWRMNCLCDCPDCRKVIGTYRDLPDSFRNKYKGYISQWLEP